jgi:hypothetical protein
MPREHGPAARRIPASKAPDIFGKINSDIRALNSSILILSQKLKYIVRNEKILGRNILVLNKKLRDSEMGGGGHGSGLSSEELASLRGEIANLSNIVSKQSEAISELQIGVQQIKDTFAKAEDVQEMKYVVDTIKPLEFVTRKDVMQLVGEEHEKKSKAKK